MRTLLCIPVNYTWSEWGSWTDCSVTCGSDGIMTRSRTCDGDDGSVSVDPSVDCGAGDDVETANCTGSVPVCPSWSAWTNWTECSETCGTNATR